MALSKRTNSALSIFSPVTVVSCDAYRSTPLNIRRFLVDDVIHRVAGPLRKIE